MEQNNNHIADTKQELSERIDQALARIIKNSRWSIVLALAIITFNQWLALSDAVIEPHVGYKMLVLSFTALVFMIISVMDLLWAGKFKNVTREQQLTGIVRYRKRMRLSGWLMFLLVSLYILVDIIYQSTGVVSSVIGIIFIALIVFILWVTQDKTSSYRRAQELEDNVRRWCELEK